MNIDVNTLTITKASKLLSSGEMSAVELAEAYLKEIEEKDDDIHAYLEVFDDVREQAARADEQIASGKIQPLTGIPMAIKDNILIEGKTASAASKILENYVAPYDATVTSKLKEAGAVLLGRVNMDEFAMGASTEQSAYGVTKNPHDTSRVPGGSSGGSAASVAGGMALASLGSDTAGSIRQPASFCGVVGLKPTYGSVSRHGLIALGSSLDVIGPIARTVEDTEIIFNTIKGKDPLDATSVDESDYDSQSTSDKLKVGIPQGLLKDLSSTTRAHFDDSVKKLEDSGIEIVPIELPHAQYGVPAYYILLPAEASANLARYDGVKYGLHVDGGDDLLADYLSTRGEGFGPEPRRRILIGTYVLSAGYYDAYYNRALSVRNHIRKDFEKAFDEVDIIMTPTSPGPAFKLGEKTNDPVQMYLEDIFTVLANHAGTPALSVPSGSVEEDSVQLPMGVQFMAPHMCEERLFDIGKKFESLISNL